jgi:hypothetical protein
VSEEPRPDQVAERAEVAAEQAFQRYMTHLGPCQKAGNGCRPPLGRLCGEGKTLHDAWRKAEAAAL